MDHQQRPRAFQIWLIWTVSSYMICGECVRSETQSARAKKVSNKRPGSRLTLCINGVKKWFVRGLIIYSITVTTCIGTLLELPGASPIR